MMYKIVGLPKVMWQNVRMSINIQMSSVIIYY